MPKETDAMSYNPKQEGLPFFNAADCRTPMIKWGFSRFSFLISVENSYICKDITNNGIKYMILEFYINNYLSIKEDPKISFVGTTLKESLPDPNDMIPVSDTGLSLVQSAVIYGANASGKTNVLKATAFYKRFIMDSFKNSQVFL